MRRGGGQRCAIQEMVMKNMKLALSVVVCLAFSSCAPTLLGTQRTPYVAASANSAVPAVAGDTVFAKYTYPSGALQILPAYFDALPIDFSNHDPNGNVASVEVNADWLRMAPEDLPGGWQISLAYAGIRKSVADTTSNANGVSISFYRQLVLVYKVTVPAGTMGSKVIHLGFNDAGKPIGQLPLLVTVGSSTDFRVHAQF